MVTELIQRAGFFLRALTQRKQDGLDLLEVDHVRLEMLFWRWRVATGVASRTRLFALIKKEFLDHSRVEEAVLYPTFEKVLELKKFVAESLEDHKLVKALLKEISELGHDHERSGVKMKILMSEVQRHVVEEENVLFPRVRLAMTKGQLDKLSREIRSARHFSKAIKRSKPSRTQKIAA